MWQNCPVHNLTRALSDPIPACQQIWSKPLSGPQPRSIALLFINYASEAVNITCNTNCLWHAGIISKATVRDLWLHQGASEFAIDEIMCIRYFNNFKWLFWFQNDLCPVQPRVQRSLKFAIRCWSGLRIVHILCRREWSKQHVQAYSGLAFAAFISKISLLPKVFYILVKTFCCFARPFFSSEPVVQGLQSHDSSQVKQERCVLCLDAMRWTSRFSFTSRNQLRTEWLCRRKGRFKRSPQSTTITPIPQKKGSCAEYIGDAPSVHNTPEINSSSLII